MVTLLTLKQEVRGLNPGAAPPKVWSPNTPIPRLQVAKMQRWVPERDGVRGSRAPGMTKKRTMSESVRTLCTHGQGGGWWGDTPMHVVKPYLVTYAVYRLYHPPSRSKNDRCSPMCDAMVAKSPSQTRFSHHSDLYSDF